jgi:acetolactate synthase-1/2/3 large subunit
MLGMHGTYEANMAMHDCDVMINASARASTTASPAGSTPSRRTRRRSMSISIRRRSTRTSASTCRSSAIAAWCWRTWCASGAPRRNEPRTDKARCAWWSRSTAGARATRSASRTPTRRHQAAIRHQRLYEADQGPRHLHHHRSRPAPDVGGAALPLRGAEPLDDLGRPRHHGLWPAGRGRRAGGASGCAGHRHRRRSLVQMTMQEMSTAVQYRLPIKIFILNNEYGWAWCASGRSCCTATAVAQLHREPARFRQAGRGLWRQGHPLRRPGRARRRDPGDDRL